MLVHIGYHKTGTTWFQQELFTVNSEDFVPVSKRNRGHSSLARHFVYDAEGYLLSPFDDNESVIRAELADIQSLKGFSSGCIPVISHERLSGNPHSSGFDSEVIARRIQRIFPTAKILILIREQTSWIVSNYFQYLSAGGTHTLRNYLGRKYDGKRPGFSPHHIAYHHLIAAYQDRFGKEQVLVLPYEGFHSDEMLFWESLSGFLGKTIQVGAAEVQVKHNQKRAHFLNYHLRGLNYLSHSSSLNNYSSWHSQQAKFMAVLLKDILGFFVPKKLDKTLKSKLMNRVREWAGDRYAQSNHITQELTGLDLAAMGYKVGN